MTPWCRRARAAAAVLTSLACACAGDATAPPPPPPPQTVPAFVFVADSDGHAQLFRFRHDTITRLTHEAANDVDPRSAAGRLVFSSDRDGNAEVYIADADLGAARRVTNSSATDEEPALDPGGTTIAFTSNRSGTPRLWVIAAPAPTDTGAIYGVPAPLQTASAEWVPERSPAWSPDGAHIAFASTRTGTSQLYVVPATGGAATQLTHESGGAFDPAWSADGSALLYVTATGAPRIRRVATATGAAADVAADSIGIGDPSCDATLCLAATDPFGTRGTIVALPATAEAERVIIATLPGARQPAIIAP
ncbi:MAG TPA: LpqB family beta-propeller domain-containing protein [Gemmatimonadaceae bacterium]|nr:LpqB family beta-propeller domain-containing protein [Gemmatimonadaceae bacterium]